MLGMVAEPVIYLVVWTTIADQQGGSVDGLTPGYFAAYYIVWTLVRNMNIVFGAAVLGVPDPRGRAQPGPAAPAPAAPLRHRVVRGLEGRRDRPLDPARDRPLAPLRSRRLDVRPAARSSRSRSPSGARTSSGRCSRSQPRDALLLDDARRCDLRSLHDCSSSCSPAVSSPCRSCRTGCRSSLGSSRSSGRSTSRSRASSATSRTPSSFGGCSRSSSGSSRPRDLPCRLAVGDPALHAVGG